MCDKPTANRFRTEEGGLFKLMLFGFSVLIKKSIKSILIIIYDFKNQDN